MTSSTFEYLDYLETHLRSARLRNAQAMTSLVEKIVDQVKLDRSLYVFGSGHSALFTMELYHRAGGFSHLVPIVADYLLPSAGPPVVRLFERTVGAANVLLARHAPSAGEMIWIMSQSGINAAVVDFALQAKKQGLFVVSFSSHVHSSGVASRHPSGKRLFEIADLTIDLGGEIGDAIVPITSDLKAGPVSLMTAVSLGHAVLVEVCRKLEAQGIRSTYTSVNTPTGQAINKDLEVKAMAKDPLLRE